MTNQELADLLGGKLSWMPAGRAWVPAILLPTGLKVIIDGIGGARWQIEYYTPRIGQDSAVSNYLNIANDEAKTRLDGGETKENLGGVNDLNRPWLPPYPTTPPPAGYSTLPPTPSIWDWFTSLFR